MDHLEAAVFSPDELLNSKVARVLKDAKHAGAPQVEELKCLGLGQLLDQARAVVLAIERENYRLHRPGIQMSDELLKAMLLDGQNA